MAPPFLVVILHTVAPCIYLHNLSEVDHSCDSYTGFYDESATQNGRSGARI
jgi:hypothetical protein